MPLVSKRDAGGEGGERRLLQLPPGRHGLPREFVRQHQRDRIAASMIACVAERGYKETTISQIAKAAGVSRRTFYAYFSSKDECFFDTFDLIIDHLRKAATEAAAAHTEWPERVRARLATILDTFAANPDLARFLLISSPRAGSEIAARYRRAMDEVLAELTDGIPDEARDREPSPEAEHALVGGAAAIIVRRVEAGKGETLPELLPDLVEFTLTPFLGREAASRFARA